MLFVAPVFYSVIFSIVYWLICWYAVTSTPILCNRISAHGFPACVFLSHFHSYSDFTGFYLGISEPRNCFLTTFQWDKYRYKSKIFYDLSINKTWELIAFDRLVSIIRRYKMSSFTSFSIIHSQSTELECCTAIKFKQVNYRQRLRFPVVFKLSEFEPFFPYSSLSDNSKFSVKSLISQLKLYTFYFYGINFFYLVSCTWMPVLLTF